MKTVLITGVNGLIGRRLAYKFDKCGWSVRGMVRDPGNVRTPIPNVKYYQGRLPSPFDETAFHGVDAIVHCAFSSHEIDPIRNDTVNIQGTVNLHNLAQKHSIDLFVFLSSLAANAKSTTLYGQSKFRIEQYLGIENGLIVRPGLVISPDGGLFGKIFHFIRTSYLIPNFIDVNRKFYIVDIQDLCDLLFSCVENRVRGLNTIACPEPVTLKFIQECMIKRLNVKRLFLPIPAALCIAVARFLESLGIHLPFNSDQLGSLKSGDVVEDGNLTGLIDYNYKDAAQSISNMAIDQNMDAQ